MVCTGYIIYASMHVTSLMKVMRGRWSAGVIIPACHPRRNVGKIQNVRQPIVDIVSIKRDKSETDCEIWCMVRFVFLAKDLANVVINLSELLKLRGLISNSVNIHTGVIKIVLIIIIISIIVIIINIILEWPKYCKHR